MAPHATTHAKGSALYDQFMSNIEQLEWDNPAGWEIDPSEYSRLDEDANAFWLATRMMTQVRWVDDTEEWLQWEDHRWKRVSERIVQAIAVEHIRDRMRERLDVRKGTSGIDDANVMAGSVANTLKLLSRKGLTDLLWAARRQPQIRITSDVLDRDPMLLGLQNGVYDCSTGTFRAGQPGDYITHQVAVSYDPAAKCPTWDAHLDKIFEGRQDLIDAFQEAVGYSMSGDTSFDAFFLATGRGENGKSRTLKVLRRIAGDYGATVAPSALAARDNRPTAASNDLAALQGKRFVICTELDERAPLNESRIKALTGNDTITARRLYSEFEEWTPQLHLWLATNHTPRIRDDSHGFWRRLHMFPFDHSFANDPTKDPAIEDKLMAEAAGIFNWIIAGELRAKGGLTRPAASVELAASLRAETSDLGDFYEDRCVIEETATVRMKDLFRAYLEWAAANDVPERSRLNNHTFASTIRARYFVGGGKNARVAHGLRLAGVTDIAG
jgi:putative DNA primase/helicase